MSLQISLFPLDSTRRLFVFILPPRLHCEFQVKFVFPPFPPSFLAAFTFVTIARCLVQNNLKQQCKARWMCLAAAVINFRVSADSFAPLIEWLCSPPSWFCWYSVQLISRWISRFRMILIAIGLVRMNPSKSWLAFLLIERNWIPIRSQQTAAAQIKLVFVHDKQAEVKRSLIPIKQQTWSFRGKLGSFDIKFTYSTLDSVARTHGEVDTVNLFKCIQRENCI